MAGRTMLSVTTFRSAVEALPTKGPDAVGPAIAGGAAEHHLRTCTVD